MLCLGRLNIGFLLVFLIIEPSQNIVEDVVSGFLSGEDESLNEFFRLGALVRSFAYDLNDNVLVAGRLRVYVGDADFNLLKI